MAGAELNYSDKSQIVNGLRELPQLRREASNIASAIDRQTRELKEELLSVRCWLAGLLCVILLGIIVIIVLSAAK